MTAYDFPLLGVFWSVLFFFLALIWIWLVIRVVVDIFRSDDLGGLAKALWVVLIVLLPFLGVFVYLVARGRTMSDRAGRFGQPAGVAGELGTWAGLDSRGVVTNAEATSSRIYVLR